MDMDISNLGSGCISNTKEGDVAFCFFLWSCEKVAARAEKHFCITRVCGARCSRLEKKSAVVG